LARYLYIYINQSPNQPLEPLTAAFLQQVLSNQGQNSVRREGYLPLSPAVREQIRQQLGFAAQ